jgi:hypothetical protein
MPLLAFWIYSCTRFSADQLCVLMHISVLTNCVYSRARFSADQLCVSVINLIQIDHKHPISSIVHRSFGHDELGSGRAQLVTCCLSPLPVSRLLLVVATEGALSIWTGIPVCNMANIDIRNCDTHTHTHTHTHTSTDHPKCSNCKFILTDINFVITHSMEYSLSSQVNGHSDTQEIWAMPWPRWLVAGFDLGSVHVRFVVNKVSLWQVLFPVLWFTLYI